MTQEQKRIKIAEACGWAWVEDHCFKNESFMGSRACGDGWKNPKTGNVSDDPLDLPDYFNDLNACHEAEKTLTELEFGNYHDILLNQIMSVKFISAEAAQRAEAFGRVKGLWKE